MSAALKNKYVKKINTFIGNDKCFQAIHSSFSSVIYCESSFRSEVSGSAKNVLICICKKRCEMYQWTIA